jgi:hypothetical protein
MTLTCGTFSNFPCPVCLVPQEELEGNTLKYCFRSAQDTADTIQHARELNATQRNAWLADCGLRNIDVSCSGENLAYLRDH